jgi:serine/threonine protein kinase
MHQKYIDSKVYSFHDVYMLGDKIGEGNHASVYKCFRRVNPLPKNEKKTLLTFDPYLPEPFAVKVVREDDNEKILAHEHEFKVLASLKHENIVKVFECFKD